MRNEKREERNFKMEVLTVIGAVALVVIITYLINTRAQIPPVPYGYTKVVESVVIEDGDTLWDIANRYIKKYNMEDIKNKIKILEDDIYRTKDLVYEIKEINNISEDYIRTGNYVIVPYLTK